MIKDKSITSIENRIGHNFAVFQELVATAEDFMARGKWTAAAAYAQMAAHHAWKNHTGLFASPELEQLLRSIGQTISDTALGQSPKAGRDASPKKILHVLTHAYSVGGHTRMVWRWIRQDRQRAHSVALTAQGSASVPERLVDAVHAARGEIFTLDGSLGGLLAAAKRLRKLASEADLLVLHVHPYDVVPSIAFAVPTRHPPVVLVNHADHVFWLGTGICDQVVHFRSSGMRLSLERRGIEQERCSLLPIPLEPMTKTVSRSQARRQLGLPDDAILLLSVASAYKFTPVNNVSFIEAILPVIVKHPEAFLAVVGCEDDGQWKHARETTAGKIRAFGIQEDPTVFFQAADVYMDSCPFSSVTSLLEAGSHGLPIVSYGPHLAEAPVMCPDGPALDQVLIQETDLERFRAVLSDLMENREVRTTRGELTWRDILQVHSGDGWLGYLQQVYRRAAEARPGSPKNCTVSPERTNALDLWLASFHLESGISCGLSAILLSHAGLLPFGERFALWSKSRKKNPATRLRVLAPDWMRVRLRTWASAVKLLRSIWSILSGAPVRKGETGNQRQEGRRAEETLLTNQRS